MTILIKQVSIDILPQCQFCISLSICETTVSSNSVSVRSGIGLLPSPGVIENT